MNRRAWVVVGVVAAAALVATLAVGMATSSHSDAAKAGFGVAKKGESDSWADKAGLANEGPQATWEAEQAALRAYPGDSIPLAAAANSQNTYAKLKKAGGHKPGEWMQLGPTQRAEYPGVLNQLGDQKEYIASGRVTALAIAPNCTKKECRLYVGAAGGGVWTTDKALDGDKMHWKFASSTFGTNAIGALLIDPSDPSGDTVYAGTGEPNASADSEAGVGIYKSTNAGETWTLVPGSDIFYQRAAGALAFDKDGNLLVGLAGAVRGICQTAQGCALSSGSTTHPLGIRGLYRQTGATFTRIFTSALPSGAATRGVVQVALDPNNSSTIYLSSFQQGIWRSLDNGATWTQIKTALNAANNTDRAMFAVNALPGSKTRMYVGVGNSSSAAADRARVFRTDDAAGAATFADMTTPQNRGYCGYSAGAQCWYDNVVYSPAGSPDIVYIAGSYDYDNYHGPDNGRAVLLSTDGGATFSDLTLDKSGAGWLHPDHHALVTIPGSPLMWIDGNDGGVVRSNGKYVDGSNDCDSRGLDAAGTAFCKSLLWRIPEQTTSLNEGLPTLQFMSLSVDPHKPLDRLMGGTQDNGTFQFNGGPKEWPQIMYGDGGQSGFNAADGKLRFNTFTGQANDVNFQNGDPTKWVIATGGIVSSPEGSLFYPPDIADPTETFAGSIFQGSQSVWRTQDWGGDQAFLEANCPEFTTSAANPICGDFVRIGPAGATDLTGTAYGADAVAGDLIGALARARQNGGTLWAATITGRLLISDNANAAASAVTWTRLDCAGPAATCTAVANAPRRDISQIYVDGSNANRAYVAYSGYNINTPTTPGHVFRVDRIGGVATWTDLSYNLEDLPVTGVALDDMTGDLYASTDFGVWVLPDGSTTWEAAASGMPMVEVTMLNIVPDSRVLYASSHGLGAWVLNLSKK
ncbi:MAG TPA: hypothetical protein VF232_04965 [Gaiellaceae bacterium]